MTGAQRSQPREWILRRCGLVPSAPDLVRAELDRAIDALEAEGRRPIVALDAGCGRVSALARVRGRLDRVVGLDLHRPPDGALPYLDEFVQADLCGGVEPFEAASFDLVLSSFTVEHLTDPAAAFGRLAAWLRPGGWLVAVTVNRRHPFVDAYLRLPTAARGPAQRFVKERAADAHPLVGSCNDPRALRATLAAAGFEAIGIAPVGHLARAWSRRWPTFALGLVGDLAAQPVPGRRSTLVASARAPIPAPEPAAAHAAVSAPSSAAAPALPPAGATP